MQEWWVNMNRNGGSTWSGIYTLKLKAKKLEGYNAFIIPFAVKDSNTFYRAHIGAWINKIGVFEKVTNGYDVSTISAAVDLPDTIQLNKWYDITLDVGVDTVKCYLNGNLLMTYTEPDKLFAISGKDESNGDIIVKIVNAYGNEMSANIDFKNDGFKSSNILLTTLSAPSLTDENTFYEPEKYIPVTKQLPGVASKFSLQLKPYSINIVRLKTKAN
jgi:alpha-L-arabinofuranosidase